MARGAGRKSPTYQADRFLRQRSIAAKVLKRRKSESKSESKSKSKSESKSKSKSESKSESKNRGSGSKF
jgi:hypothetical protein